jgi:hypothetical protein
MSKSLVGQSRRLSSWTWQSSKDPPKGLTFKSRMLALPVAQALPVEHFLESFLSTGSLFPAGGLFHGFWLALPSSLQVVRGS